MASKKNQSAPGEGAALNAIPITGPMTRSKSKALAQQGPEPQPMITLDFLRKDVAKKSLSFRKNSYSRDEFTHSVSDEFPSYGSYSHHLVIQGKMCHIIITILLHPQLLSLCLLL